MKKLRVDVSEVGKDLRRLWHKAVDLYICVAWDVVDFVIGSCKVVWQRSKCIAMAINDKTAPVEIAEFLLPKPAEKTVDNVITVNF